MIKPEKEPDVKVRT